MDSNDQDFNFVKIIEPEFHSTSNLVGTEAELVNAKIDSRVVQFQSFWKPNMDKRNPHDLPSVIDEIKKEKMNSKEDRLGLRRTVDIHNTVWARNFIIDNRSDNTMAEEQKEPQWPFAQGQPIYAFFSNDARDVLTFFLRQPDDSVETHTIDKAPTHEAAWHHLRKMFTEDDLNRNTQREIDKINALRDEQENEHKVEKEKEMQERLFQLKVDAFELPIINDSSVRELKSSIRKAKNELEVYGAVGAIYALHYTSPQPEAEVVPDAAE